ncbi:unnamed protein product [Cyberlindnera jadinii]|uniref:Uncharacterized protein n=1 Tax=Cyberlindnera jadinii (strain ATCC 18201 / CBS 1600 / BCRC 20928 / JCM 3617 / NBRC 0987 / NRRL Y-1542) TaxID=983966 RepID=A0A0H5CKC3_CYBJN|nr:unnamed protein product [Cyberlindnera jadinii]
MVTPAGNNVCRRCKKKRPEDEPMETARYRTCKPCREIERKRKRLKKLNISGMDAEVAAAAAAAAEQARKNAELERNIINIAAQSLPPDHAQQLAAQHMAQQLAAHQQQEHQNQLHHGPPEIHQYDQSKLSDEQSHGPILLPTDGTGGVDDREIPIDENLLKQGTGEDSKASLTKSSDLLKQGGDDDSNNIFAIRDGTIHGDVDLDVGNPQARTTSTNHSLAAVETVDSTKSADLAVSSSISTSLSNGSCLYCGAPRSVYDDGRYQLCGNCVSNPLERNNVFDDFEAYLERIGLGKDIDLKNVIYIKKIDDESIIQDFTQDNLDTILLQIQVHFVDRILERSGYKFSKLSSNLSVKPFPKSIKLLYRCKQDLKTTQKNGNSLSAPVSDETTSGGTRKMKTEDCHSNFYLSYDVIGKNMSIKFNHNCHKTFLQKWYSPKLIATVKELQIVFQDINLVFENLTNLKDIDESLKHEIAKLKKVNFVKDFALTN